MKAASTTVSAPAPGRVLDLEAIDATLRDLQAHFREINELLKSRRDAIDDSLIANMWLATISWIGWSPSSLTCSQWGI